MDDVLPGRRARVLEVRHEDAGARVHGVDHHLAVDGARDLDATVPEVGRNRCDLPVGLGRGQQLGKRARVELGLPLATPLEELEPGRVQLAVELGDELECLRRENVRGVGERSSRVLKSASNWASSVEPDSARVELSPSAWSSGVEVAGADLSLVACRGVAALLEVELPLLQLDVGGHAAGRVAVRELEHRLVEAWKPASVTNWNRYPSSARSSWKLAICRFFRWLRQLNDGEQL